METRESTRNNQLNKKRKREKEKTNKKPGLKCKGSCGPDLDERIHKSERNDAADEAPGDQNKNAEEEKLAKFDSIYLPQMMVGLGGGQQQQRVVPLNRRL